MATSTIKEIYTKEQTISTAKGTAKATRMGNVVTFQFLGVNASYPNGWTDIGTLDSEFRPSDQTDFLGFDNDASTMVPVTMRILPNGLIRIYKFASQTANMNVYGICSYLKKG